MRRSPLLLACLGIACGPRVQVPPSPPRLGSRAGLAVDPSITTGTLDNGLTWFIEENPYPAGRVELRLVVRAGSVLEQPDQWGAAHFVEHMAFNGTRDFPGNEVIAFLEAAGVSFGSHLNAYTSYDETVYMLQVPTDDPELLPTALSVLDNWAEGILFDPEEVDRERGVVLEEWRSDRGADTRAWDTTRPILYAGSAYGDHDVIGTEASLKAMTRQALVDFYDSWYRPELMAVVVVGDLDPATVQAEIESVFSDNTNPVGAPPRDAVVLPLQDGVRVLSQADPERTESSISLLETTSWRWPSDEAGIKALFTEDLAHDILRMRLADLARRPQTPFVAAGVGYEDLNRVQGFRTYGARARVGRELEALEAVLAEVRRLELHGVHESELDTVRRDRLDGARSWLQTEDHAPSSEATDEIIRHFLDDEWMAGTEAEVAFYEALLPTITTGDISGFVKSLRTRRSQLVLVEVPGGPEAPGAPDDDAVRSVVATADTATLEPWPEPEPVGTLVDQTPVPGSVVETETFARIGVTRWTLANGAQVLVKPTALAKNEILIQGWSRGGSSLVSDADFTNAAYMPAIAMRSGIAGFDRLTLERFLSGKQASVGLGLSQTRESLSATTRPEDLELTLKMLHQRFNAPRFEEDALVRLQAVLREKIPLRLANPDARLGDFLDTVVYNNHPRVRFPTEDDVAGLSLATMQRLYAERFANAADFQFVFVGDVDLETLQPLVQTWIGSLPGDSSEPETEDLQALPVPNRGPRTEILRAGTEPLATVRVYLDASQPYTREGVHRTRTVQLLLREALRSRIREELGGSYGVAVSMNHRELPGEPVRTTIRFACDPDRVDELLEAALETVRKVRDEPVDADALQRVLAQRARQRELGLQKNQTWASWLRWYPSRGWSLDDISRFELHDEALLSGDTPEAVHGLAQALLDTETAFVVVQLPEDNTGGTTIDAAE